MKLIKLESHIIDLEEARLLSEIKNPGNLKTIVMFKDGYELMVEETVNDIWSNLRGQA